MPEHVDTELLQAALAGFEHQRLQIEQKMADLRRMIDGGGRPAAPAAATPKKRRISAAGRARIVAATKRRWAAWRKARKA